MNRDVFDEWIACLNTHGAVKIAESAVAVHDGIWTAQKIVESRFGKEALSDRRLVMMVFMLMKSDKMLDFFMNKNTDQE